MQQDDPRNIFFNQRKQFDEAQRQSEVKAQCGTTPFNQSENFGGDNFATTDGANGSSESKSTEQTYEQKVAEMKRLAAKYQREGEGQLVKDIVNNVIEQKASGKLTNDQLLAFAKRISPLLNSEQRSRLNGLVEQLLKL